MARFMRHYKVEFIIPNGKTVTLESYKNVNPLNIEFHAKYTGDKKPPTMQLSIYNLAPDTIADINKETLEVILSVGYADPYKQEEPILTQVFAGKLTTQVKTTSKSGDRKTSMSFHDGWDIFTTQLSLDVKGKISSRNLIQKILADIQLKSGGLIQTDKALEFLGDAKFRRPDFEDISVTGAAHANLEEYLSNEIMTYSIEGGQLRVWQVGKSTRSKSVLELSTETGQLTIPQPVANKQSKARGWAEPSEGYSVRCLLIPSIRPGSDIKIEIDNRLSQQQVFSVSFKGAYAGQSWYSDIETRLHQEDLVEIIGLAGGIADAL